MLGLKLWKIYLTSLVENMKSNFELHFVVFFIMKPTIVLIIIILLLLISMGFHSTLWVVLLEIS